MPVELEHKIKIKPMTNEPKPLEAEVLPTQAVAVREQQAAAIPPPAALTPAQAKVDAVANLTMKAYERAATLVFAPEEIAALEEQFPDEAFKLGAGGDANLIYIEHAHLRDRLNKVFKPGQWAIIPRNRWGEDFETDGGKKATRIYVEAMLVIRGAFVAEAVGDMVYYHGNAKTNYGDAVEGAKSACLRRCAKELGIGLQAWKKDFCEGWKARNNGQRPPPAPPASRPAAAPQPAARPAPARPAATGSPGDGLWKSVTVPKFIKKYAGSTLGEMAEKDLAWWCENYEPKPWKGKISQADLDFKAALDAAYADLLDNGESNNDGGNVGPADDDSVPF
jgi:hypothetical protein